MLTALVAAALSSVFKTRAALQLENLANPAPAGRSASMRAPPAS